MRFEDGISEIYTEQSCRAVLDSRALNELTEHAESSYPKEGCGILFGRKREGPVTEIKRMGNAAGGERAKVSYVMDPAQVYKAEKEALGRSLELLGFYHTHPDHEAVPSAEDEEQMIPGMIYLILSVVRGHCESIRAYIKDIDDGRITQIGDYAGQGRSTEDEGVYLGNAQELFRKKAGAVG